MDGIFEHPSRLLDPTVANLLRSHATEAELNAGLHERQLRIIHDQRWFKLFIPIEYGGLGLPLVDSLRLEEAVSYADGSTGWVVTLCAGAGWFSGYLDPELTRTICSNPHLCIAGSGSTGKAVIRQNGFEVSGLWKYASGSLHATALTVNCILYATEGQPLRTEDSQDQMASFLLFPNEVNLKRTWNAMGMRATASHSFEATGLRIPVDRKFCIDENRPVREELIYKYPFLQFAEVTLAATISGMAHGFVDLAEPLILGREQDATSVNVLMFHHAKDGLTLARNYFYKVINRSWDELRVSNVLSDMTRTHVSDASRLLVHRSREVVNTLYPLCGMSAANLSTEINRVWRNLNTAIQHSLFR